MITRRRVLLAVLALFLFGVGYVAWTLAGLPPVKYYLRYGLAPYCEPTGAKITLKGIEFIEIGPGIFRMGSDEPEEHGDWIGTICSRLGLPWGRHPVPSGDGPARWVEFHRGFWIACTETTNEQYERFEPGRARDWASQGDQHPVVNVLRSDALGYCAWLAERTDRGVRLPSEAEWECVCRAGGDGRYGEDDDPASVDNRGWFFEQSGGLQARSVATLPANAWGFHDLQGNVWEYCADLFAHSHEGSPTDGRPRSEHGARFKGNSLYVTRGGSYLSERSVWAACAARMFWEADYRSPDQGFRLAFSNPDD